MRSIADSHLYVSCSAFSCDQAKVDCHYYYYVHDISQEAPMVCKVGVLNPSKYRLTQMRIAGDRVLLQLKGKDPFITEELHQDGKTSLQQYVTF